MRRICSDLYYKFDNKSPKRLNTLYESMHNQCCKKNCGVWNYIQLYLGGGNITFDYDRNNVYWSCFVRKEDIICDSSKYQYQYIKPGKFKHHFCNKCNYNFYTIK